jgi:MOSC domain-containing protein
MHLASLHIYPVKSCAGIQVDSWELDACGFRYDRRWMVTTPRGQFLTQRECPALALVRVTIAPPHLRLEAPDLPELLTPLHPMGGRPVSTMIWEDQVSAVAPDHKADDWFSRIVGQEVVLAYMPDEVIREVDRFWAPRGGRTGFADGFPFLLAGESSLADLNARLARPLPMNRFRPNLVVRGSEPFAEDGWRSIAIGGIPMEVVKPCARCVVTTTDQASGRRDGDEPLRTLATFRRQDGKVMFGQNVVHYGTGRLSTGDPVQITGGTAESGPSSPDRPPGGDPGSPGSPSRP